MDQQLRFRSAFAAVLALGAFSAQIGQAQETKPAAKEKCYGIAKAGKNSCGTASHACAGYAKTDNAPDEWVSVARGTCLKMGGKLAPPATPAKAPETPKPAAAEKPKT
jgi:uncharacterized membrane protein